MANPAKAAKKQAEEFKAKIDNVNQLVKGELDIGALGELAEIFEKDFKVNIPGGRLIKKALLGNALSQMFFPNATGDKGVVDQILSAAKGNSAEAKSTLGKLVGAIEDMFKMKEGTLSFIAERCNNEVDKQIDAKKKEEKAAKKTETAPTVDGGVKTDESPTVGGAAKTNDEAPGNFTAAGEREGDITAALPDEAVGDLQNIKNEFQKTVPPLSRGGAGDTELTVKIELSGTGKAVTDAMDRLGIDGKGQAAALAEKKNQQPGYKPQGSGGGHQRGGSGRQRQRQSPVSMPTPQD